MKKRIGKGFMEGNRDQLLDFLKNDKIKVIGITQSGRQYTVFYDYYEDET